MVTMVVEQWGEGRERARMQRRRRRTKWAAFAAVGMLVGVPFTIGLVDGLLNRPNAEPPAGMVVAITLALAALALAASWLNWRESDEVQRRVVANSWAAAGFTTIILYPVASIVGDSLGWGGSASGAWVAGAAAGIIALFYQRVRG
jgi:hypothetical protein